MNLSSKATHAILPLVLPRAIVSKKIQALLGSALDITLVVESLWFSALSSSPFTGWPPFTVPKPGGHRSPGRAVVRELIFLKKYGFWHPPLSSHLVEHPGLLSTPLRAERKVSATEPILNFSVIGEVKIYKNCFKTSKSGPTCRVPKSWKCVIFLIFMEN